MLTNHKLLVLEALRDLSDQEINQVSVSKTIVNLQGILKLSEEVIIDELKKLVGEGQKLQAVRLYKEFSGLGLKEAKDFVDQL